jgi:hypothetical protein
MHVTDLTFMGFEEPCLRFCPRHGIYFCCPRCRTTVFRSTLFSSSGTERDYIRDDITPNLAKLAQPGVTFTNHHFVGEISGGGVPPFDKLTVGRPSPGVSHEIPRFWLPT